MDADFIKLVHKIKLAQGPAILTDARKFRSLLADYAKGAYKGERCNFLLALEDGLVERIQSESDISEAFLRTQASFFASTYSLTEDAVQFVIWGWAEVLGLHINSKPVLLRDAGHASAAGPQAGSAGSSANQARPSAPPPTPNTKMPAITGNSHTNSIGMEFSLIPAGTFMMGSNEYSDERPIHQVTLTQPFYLGKFPVTQAQWQAVMGENPSQFEGWFKGKNNHPVEMVSWNNVQTFIRRLNEKEKKGRYRLPTEAEWEYAARAGSQTAYCFGNDESQLEDYAWYGESWKTGSPHPVGQKKPNVWGLYDMYGNVWEWCQDWYADWYYGASPSVDPKGPDSGAGRLLRGGGWYSFAGYCRSAGRSSCRPDLRLEDIGFRLAFSP